MSHTPPEAPVPTSHSHTQEQRPGMAPDPPHLQMHCLVLNSSQIFKYHSAAAEGLEFSCQQMHLSLWEEFGAQCEDTEGCAPLYHHCDHVTVWCGKG